MNLLLAAASACLLAAAATPTGPEVGQHVPDFHLRDQNGAAKSLRDVLGPKGAMLVFFRSADW
ncbi:MAG: redoxin domain-containing protein [Acidobacteria bacterium]|nr:redoxin domain-containing protein [Acidobacteriota bacterium]